MFWLVLHVTLLNQILIGKWKVVLFISGIFIEVYYSQRSVATCSRCGGIFSDRLIVNFLLNAAAKKFQESVNIWRRHGQKSAWAFFDWQQCRRNVNCVAGRTLQEHNITTRKLTCPKDAPYIIMVAWKFSKSLNTPTAIFHEIFNGLLLRLILWMCVQNLKFVT